MKRSRSIPLLAAVAFLIGAVAGAADAPPAPTSFVDALRQGKFSLGLRYRFEWVDDDARPKDGVASTLRTTLSYRTLPWAHVSAFVELEDVHAIGGDTLYDNKGAGSLSNGVHDRAVIADPEVTELQQAYLDADLGAGTRLRIGRQEIALDDQRFVGPVGWRQNHQSFDAASVESTAIPGAKLSYTYVDNVNTITGGDVRMASHLVHGTVGVGPAGELALFGYLLDYTTANASDTATFGARLAGNAPAGAWKVSWDLSWARQKDWADNPADLAADFGSAALGATHGAFHGIVGGELLGSDHGTAAFQTPLATLHKFDGWADKFLSTPANGLVDLYAEIGGKHGAIGWTLVWHDFSADRGNADYGTELDALLTWKSGWGELFAVKAARYDADQFSTDTTKVIVFTTWGF